LSDHFLLRPSGVITFAVSLAKFDKVRHGGHFLQPSFMLRAMLSFVNYHIGLIMVLLAHSPFSSQTAHPVALSMDTKEASGGKMEGMVVGGMDADGGMEAELMRSGQYREAGGQLGC
jgi:hypothetical protein